MMIKTVKTGILAIWIILAVVMFLPTTLPALANPNMMTTQVKPVTVNLTGTIKKLAVEGTCYQLAADDGKKYELMGKFPKIDGTKVRVSGVVTTDVATICQVGQPLKVKTVRVIK
jgi:hypothetical protein